MSKKEFQAESKKLLDLMINSIYTQKEIFLRELISNASDAIDKIYYRALTDEDMDFNKSDYYIEIKPNIEERKLVISDRGIGMTEEELDENLGVIAKSGSLDFKLNNKEEEDIDIIGQFGVGFYSAFMVADKIEVITKSLDSSQAYRWESSGEDGYIIEESFKEEVGTDIILHIKEDQEEYEYSNFLDQYYLVELVKKYSDYIRYPIKMELEKTRLKEDSEEEYENYREFETINSMVPIWRKNKNDLEEEDYENFYYEKGFGYNKPLRHIHMKLDGLLRFNSILYIPSQPAFNFYSTDYEKGLELYSKGVMIMEKCPQLLPDYLSFVRGVVDSEDLSLNISREMLQHDRQLNLIAKNIEKKVLSELASMMENERELYEEFFQAFGTQLKFGIYDNFGQDKDKLEDLILFYSSKEKKAVSLKEYLERMKDGQEYIYYAAGESLDKVDKLPQTELLKDEGYEIIYLLDNIDEFVIKVMDTYETKEFRSVTSDDLGIESLDTKDEIEELLEENQEIFSRMKEALEGKVVDVKPSLRLKNHPVCLASQGEISIEMEKLLRHMPEGPELDVEKVLEINTNHHIFNKLKDMEEGDERFKLYMNLLYDQARLIEGLDIEDPVEFTNNICKLM